MKKRLVRFALLGISVIIGMFIYSGCNTINSSIDESSTSASVEQSIENSNGGDTSTDSSTHIHTFVEFVTAPTCEEEGYTTHTCNCGESYVDSYITALEHEFINYISDNNATCEKDGTQTASCSRQGCDATDTVVESGTRLIKVEAYIDNQLSQTLYTNQKNNYVLTLPEKPRDITISKNIESYFYGWFLDEDYTLSADEQESFEENSIIYAKWIKTDATVFNYTVSNGEATITGIKNSTQTILVIPGYINTFPVVAIGNFKGKTMLKKVIICDGVQVITTKAFEGCSSLEEINVPESVTKLQSRAFLNCTNLKKLYFDAVDCRAEITDMVSNTLGEWRGIREIFGGINDNQLEVIIGKNVEAINSFIFHSHSYDVNKAPIFKSFTFENPYGWYEIDAMGLIKVDDMNAEFQSNQDYKRIDE